jgi:DNA-binding winged helix-turn-helix (wHTH) protein
MQANARRGNRRAGPSQAAWRVSIHPETQAPVDGGLTGEQPSAAPRSGRSMRARTMEGNQPDGVTSRSGDFNDVVYVFREFELCPRALELRRNGRALHVTAKSLTALLYLVQHHDRLVSKTELMRMVWPAANVGAGSVSQAIWELRGALGDGRSGVRFIRTLRGVGYRFCVEVAVRGRRRERD